MCVGSSSWYSYSARRGKKLYTIRGDYKFIRFTFIYKLGSLFVLKFFLAEIASSVSSWVFFKLVKRFRSPKNQLILFSENSHFSPERRKKMEKKEKQQRRVLSGKLLCTQLVNRFDLNRHKESLLRVPAHSNWGTSCTLIADIIHDIY